MKHTRKLTASVLAVCLAALLLFALSGCSGAKSAGKFAGTWRELSSHEATTLEIEANGTLRLSFLGLPDSIILIAGEDDFHLYEDCAGLNMAVELIQTTPAAAIAGGNTKLCDNCAKRMKKDNACPYYEEEVYSWKSERSSAGKVISLTEEGYDEVDLYFRYEIKGDLMYLSICDKDDSGKFVDTGETHIMYKVN